MIIGLLVRHRCRALGDDLPVTEAVTVHVERPVMCPRRVSTMQKTLWSTENTRPLGRSKSSATTRTSPVAGSARYTWHAPILVFQPVAAGQGQPLVERLHRRRDDIHAFAPLVRLGSAGRTARPVRSADRPRGATSPCWRCPSTRRWPRAPRETVAVPGTCSGDHVPALQGDLEVEFNENRAGNDRMGMDDKRA
jgi:hypothetical protein